MERVVDITLQEQLAQLITSLSQDNYLLSGYNAANDTWEVIVLYNGDIRRVAQELQAEVEILDDEYAIMNIAREKVKLLALYPEVTYVEKPKGLGPTLDVSLREACIAPVQNFPPYQLKGAGTLVGIIDTGIDYTHPDFISPDGKTRIAAIWDQSIPGNPPAGFEIGTEFTREQINEALSSGTPLPTQDTAGHGTQVAGIAAGNGRASNGRYIGAAPESELLVVKLKQIGIRGFSSTTEIMRAVKYLVDKAIQLNKPIAINLSFGTNEGSHDGNSLFENYINKTIRRGKTTMIVATGNEGDKGRHTAGKLQNRQNTVIEFEVTPQNTAISLEMWKNFVDEFDISITAPSGRTTALAGDANPFQETVIANTIVYIQKVPPNPFEKDDHFVIILTPRQRDGLIDGGIWKINIFPKNIVVGDFDIWLPVSEVLAGQTRFLQPVLERSLTIPSTARDIISVGAYDTLLNNIGIFSGRGYPRGDIYPKPDIVAPGVNIRTTNKGGGYTTSSGTSLAAPFVTGSSALIMEWGIVRGNDPFLYGEILKSYLTRGATRMDNIVYPNSSWGYGRLCLRTSMDNIIQTRSSQDALIEEKIEETMPYLYSPYIITSNEKDGMTLSEIYTSFPYSGQDVLIAVIDSGIDYLHPVFLQQDGKTKIYEIWDQTNTICPPENFSYGTIYGFDTINRALQLHKQGKNAYEIVPMKDETGHGTALAGLAAGSCVETNQKKFTGVAPQAQLLIVKVKEADQSLKEKYNLLDAQIPVYQSNDVAAGIYYAYHIASKLMKPLIVLISMGSYHGVRTGALHNSLFYKDMSNKKGLIMISSVVSEIENCKHSQIRLAGSGDVKKIEFTVDIEEKGFNIDIWVQIPDRISLSMITPINESVTILYSGYARVEEQFELQSAILSVKQIPLDKETGEQHFILIFKNPLQGKWRLNIHGELIINGTVDVYLPRQGWVKQGTCFPSSSRLDSKLSPSSSECLITPAAYDYVNHTVLPSVEGRVQRNQFDLVAPGVDMLCPTPGGGFNSGTGCSIAAAITAGSCALLAEWDTTNNIQMNINTIQAKSMLLAMAKREMGKKYPNSDWGYGILDFNKFFRPSQQNQHNQQNKKNIKIGYSIANLRVEYWKKTKDLLVQRAAELGVDLSILSANNNDIRQIVQAKSLVDAGIDVLIITPHNSEAAAEIVEYAHSKGVPVIAYERLLLNSDLDAYISTDHEKAGQLQAEYMTKIVPSGNYVYIGGPSSDYGAVLRRKGVLDALKPYLDSGKIKLVYNEMTKDWIPFGAQEHMLAALQANNNDIDAVITGADDLVNGAVAVLATQQLAGKIPIAGINANLDALQRIIDGVQTMTIYRPVKEIAKTALETAITLAKKEKFNTNAAVYNGKIQVPSVLIQPTTVDKNNIIETVIKDGYQSYEQVYENIPEEERPKK